MTKDQKTAAIVGAVALALVVFFVLMGRRISLVPPGSTVADNAPSIGDLPLGYMSYNVPNGSSPSIMPLSAGNVNLAVGGTNGGNGNYGTPIGGCGCAAKTDGCFTGIATGSSPLSLDQLLASSGSTALLAAINKTVPRITATPTLAEMAKPSYIDMLIQDPAARYAFGHMNPSPYPANYMAV